MNTDKCILCDNILRYDFEIENRVCEECEIKISFEDEENIVTNGNE